MKPLKTLIRLHRWHLEEKRRKLAELERLRSELTAQTRRLEERLAAEALVAEGSDEGRYAYGAYAASIISRREKLAASIEESQHAIGLAHDEVNEAFREVKKHEIAERIRDRRAQAVLARREQALLDEVGLNMHYRRRHQDAATSPRKD